MLLTCKPYHGTVWEKNQKSVTVPGTTRTVLSEPNKPKLKVNPPPTQNQDDTIQQVSNRAGQLLGLGTNKPKTNFKN